MIATNELHYLATAPRLCREWNFFESVCAPACENDIGIFQEVKILRLLNREHEHGR